ncbi:type I polyketide synthase [Glaciimonas immobilis]|uniref:Acyl transferase domain-containing protein/acyl-CoA synthetase (AMP-forming)/AMP-acid ligase II/SAM-dependent methyltransferase n=1 Tax=Glaciimonas immobilis TaxID=728004 RepID=A0A840RTC3_9BURK|nr:type I polyketide synthase [Glaciimonas immobilis]KAF3996556.1 AMP-binding protein [Glaciimonas immobilis]MBB5201075.1 acyl transferase domain-containing protein/acyl-CoA synthetase (AMP-forming)/AMP-acid ligase II/SAM-dependent methyltransferase [Glaciimonas immobilis]
MISEQNIYDFQNLPALLQYRASSLPSKVIYSFLRNADQIETTITYDALKKRAFSVSAYLMKNSEPGSRIALLFPQCPGFLYAFWGCLCAGRIAVPLPPPRISHLQETLAKIKDIIDSAAPQIILTTREIKKAVQLLKLEEQILSNFIWLAVEDIDIDEIDFAVISTPDNVAMLQYTSGSTSLPKGVMLTHENLLSNMHYFEQGMVHGSAARVLTWLPPFHDLGLIYGLLTPVYVDASCYIMPGPIFAQQPGRWIQAISHFRITHTAAPNFAYDSARKSVTDAQLAMLDLSCWSSALNGGEPVRAKTMNDFAERFAAVGFDRCVFNPCWGLAEASCIVTATHNGSVSSLRHDRRIPQVIYVNGPALSSGEIVYSEQHASDAIALCSSGSALADTVLSIVDPQHLTISAPDTVGEIWVDNRAVAAGYWEQAEKTAEIFAWNIAQEPEHRSYMRTGDLGFIRDGQLFVTGRMKDIVIIRGQCHYPQDIECALESAHPEIRQGSVIVFSIQTDNREAVAAVIEVSRHFKLGDNTSEILNALRRVAAENCGLQLEAITLIALGTLPRTTSGKVQRARARRQFLDRQLSVKLQWVLPELAGMLQFPEQDICIPTHALIAAPAVHPDEQHIYKWLVLWIAKTSGLDISAIQGNIPLSDYGLDSITVVMLSGEMAKQFGLSDLSPSTAYDYPTVKALAEHIAQRITNTSQTKTSATLQASDTLPDSIAIIGMSCRVPGAADLATFWSLIKSGACSVGKMPLERQALLRRLGCDPEDMYCGYLNDIDKFDPAFFNISPREAEQMDPQQRLLLQTTWHAMEHAGLTRDMLDGSRTGVFVALCATDYATLCSREGISLDGHAGAGLATSIAASRISYCFNLRGPSLVIDTACSSSLVAIHQAVQSLERGDCDTAVVAGVNLILSPLFSSLFKRAGMLSPTGMCHSFDTAADGYVRSEGVAAVILTRADIARTRQDRVLAWIAGTAINQDGRSFGLTAPNGEAQREVMRAALKDAGILATAVNYVEAHGTGTVLGDAIEYSALADIYGSQRDTPCQIGAVKANIGHLEATAGLASLIKVILCLREQSAPPLAGFTVLNPTFPKAKGLKFASDSSEPVVMEYGGMTSMGFGGTNAHVILKRANNPEASVFAEGPRILPLAAASAESLNDLLTLCAKHLKSAPEQWQGFTVASAHYRSALPYRLAVVGKNADDMIERLLAKVGTYKAVPVHRPPRIAFVFSGQGVQQVDMGRQWYEKVPIFRNKVDQCDDLLKSRCGASVRDLFDGSLAIDVVKARIAHTSDAQLMIAVCELALATWLTECGLTPDCVFGHSLGEYVAAHVAGALSLDDTLYLIHIRGQAMNAAPDGGMLAVRASLDRVQTLIAHHSLDVELAAINSSEDVTVAGTVATLEQFSRLCQSQNMMVIPLPVAKAFHSSHMTEAASQLAQKAVAIISQPPRIPLFGNAEGSRVAVCDAKHWMHHMRASVKFGACTDEALAEGYTVMIELGGRALQPFLSKVSPDRGVAVAMAAGRGEWENALLTFSELYMLGLNIKWPAIYENEISTPDLLPSYPFSLQSYWLDQEPGAAIVTNRQLAGQPLSDNSATHDTEARVDTEQELKIILGKMLKLAPDSLDTSLSFLDLGADSLVLIEMTQVIEKQFDIKLTVQQLFSEQNTLKALCSFMGKSGKSITASLPAIPRPSMIQPEKLQEPINVSETGTEALAAMTGAVTAEVDAHLPYHALFKHQLDTFRHLVESQISLMQSIGSQPHHQNHASFTAEISQSNLSRQSMIPPFKPFQVNHSTTSQPLKNALNQFAVAAFTCALTSIGESGAVVLPESVDAFSRKLGVVPERLQLWRRVCTHLADAGIMRINEDVIQSVSLPNHSKALIALETALETYKTVMPLDSAKTSCATLLLRCARQLANVLTGYKNGAEVLFSGNGIDEVAAIYATAPGTDGVHSALAETFQYVLKNRMAFDRPLHILEVGAGTGTTTHKLLPQVASVKNTAQHYLFTDISPAFVNRARKTFESCSFMEFAVFDLEREIEEQSLPHQQFDFIIAANVVHSTADLHASLGRLHSMLTPHGTLLLVECIAQQPWLDLIFGLTDGWWRYIDTALRREGPLLNEKTWHSVLEKQEWQEVKVCTFDDTQALVYARR